MAVNSLTSETKEITNYGLNKFSDERARNYAEIDYIMHALGHLPDLPQVPLINYKQKFFTKLANQSLPTNWRLQMEKMSVAAQPSEVPQFHPSLSKATSLQVDAQNLEREISLGRRRYATELFRPEGRLLSTLHEHRSPVTTVAVTDD